jgi:DNA repair protein RecO
MAMSESSSAHLTTPALLASVQSQGEADALVTFFTPDAGVQHTRARGLRRPHSKLAHLLKPADELNIILTAGRMRTPLLTGVTVVRQHAPWQQDLYLLALYWFMLEAACLGSGSPPLNTALFTLIVNLLRSDPPSTALGGAAAVFALKLLALHGLLPDLAHCAEDGHAFSTDEPLHLLPNGEGLIGRAAYNAHYARHGGGLYRLEPAQARRWRVLLNGTLLDYLAAGATRHDAALLSHLVALRLGEMSGRQLASVAFLRQQWQLDTLDELLRAQQR